MRKGYISRGNLNILIQIRTFMGDGVENQNKMLYYSNRGRIIFRFGYYYDLSD